MRRNRQLEIAVALFLAFVVCACGASQRKQTLEVTYRAATIAEAGFATWSAAHADDLQKSATSEAEGMAKLEAYRKQVTEVELAFVAAYRTLLTAMYFDNGDTLQAALTAWQALQDVIKKTTGRSWP